MKKRLIRGCLLVLAVVGILDTLIISSRSGGKDFGILLPSIGGVCIIFGLLFTRTKLYTEKSKLFNKIGKLILSLFALWLVSFIIVVTILITSAISDKEQQVDCIITLGAGLKGETPTLVLVERLNYTIEYFNENPDTKIIVSGGQGPGETITEAEAMKRYLIDSGIPQDVILKEEQSTSTYENMIFSKKLYERTFGTRLKKVMIITNDFHMFRSKMLAKRADLEPYGISSGTPWYIYPNVLLREYFALFKSLILDR